MNSRPSGKAPGGRFQTPEHLDRALYVTTPKAWLALLVLTVIVGAAVAWSIMGKVSSYVQAEGIVLSRGGMIVDAESSAGGTLSRILPSVGDTVIEGELVAEVSDAETMARYVSAVSLAEEWAQILKDREAEAKEENALAAENIARERARLDELERTGRERVNKIRERLRQNEDLLARGITNLATIERGEQALDLARRNLFDALHRRDEMEAAHLRRANDLKARVAEAKAEQVAAQSSGERARDSDRVLAHQGAGFGARDGDQGAARRDAGAGRPGAGHRDRAGEPRRAVLCLARGRQTDRSGHAGAGLSGHRKTRRVRLHDRNGREAAPNSPRVSQAW